MSIKNIFKPSIQRNILFSFGVVIILNIIFTVFSFSRLNQVRSYAEDVVPIGEEITLTQDFALILQDIDSNIQTYLVTTNPQLQIEIQMHLADARAALDKISGTKRVLAQTEYDVLDEVFEDFEMQIQTLFSQNFADLSTTVRNLQIIEVFDRYDSLTEAEQDFSAATLASLNLISNNQQRIISSFAVIFLVLNFVSLIVAVVTSQFASRSIASPVARTAEVAMQMAEGQLQVRVQSGARNDEIGLLARAFNSMADQLNELIEDLEQRVEERTRDLRVAADVARQVSRVLDMKQLLPYLVNTTRDGFNLSHVSIFLYEENTNILRLAAGSGSVGRVMLERGKQFHLQDVGLVPLSARSGEHQIINDVQASEDYFPNPLLPNTRSETALPMRVGTRLIGVLDLQADDVGRFNEEQIAVLSSLADQIAVAVQNAGLFTNLQAARADAEQASVVKSQFLASMSHELRTPLNAVLNFTQFVSSGMLGKVNAEQVEMLDKVVASGQHLLSLINDVLDISKIESGALKLFVETNIDMATEVETVLATAKGMLAEKPVELLSDIELDLPVVIGDKRRIRQIMLNLVSNACKFTDEGEVRISLKQEGGFVRFIVADTGFGIAEEDHDTIFETFRQSDGGLRQGEGTGLGLPISLRLAETHGGTLNFVSTLNVGSTFSFTIPINNPQLAALVSKKEKTNVA